MQTVNAQDANVNTTDNASAVELPNAISAGAAVEMIPLRSLVESPYNQRKKARTEATILEFADNIRAVGLLQNLVVHPMKKRAKKAQTYGVAAGETRRLGLLFNVERGDITSDYLVPCKVISEADAILTSATENDLRKPPHPADQFIAYKALTDEGRSPEFIAAVFKVTPKTVAGHLKLASVSPKLFELFAE
jgi:ParB family transcriptional regulator, chromosome partitioning protein